MAAIREASQQETSSHSLVFRVMRLCRPALHADLHLRTRVDDLWQGEEAAEETFLNSLARARTPGAGAAGDPATAPNSSTSSSSTSAATAASTDDRSSTTATTTGMNSNSGSSTSTSISSNTTTSSNTSASTATTTSSSSSSSSSNNTGGSVTVEDDYFRARVELRSPLDALGLGGLLVLPQSFGSIHLGETFCSYISVGNHATHDVSSVVIKAELQTERQRVVLADNSKHPLERIQAGGRHDFIIEHDIKELGAHTLVCSASYIDFGESKSLPQYFKFVASNPLSVKTKVRAVKEQMFLEASIENCGKSGLFLDRVNFEPVAPWKVTELSEDRVGGSAAEEEDQDLEEDLLVWDSNSKDTGSPGDDAAGIKEEEGPEGRKASHGEPETALVKAGARIRDMSIESLGRKGGPAARKECRKQHLKKLNSAYNSVFKSATVLVPNGGTQHFLYCLSKLVPDPKGAKASPGAGKGFQAEPGPPTPTATPSHEGGGTLGRLEIAWRSTLGEPGRLQTQQILGNPVSRKEVEIRLLSLPPRVFLEHPFLVDCQLVNHTDRTVGPLRIVIAREDPTSTSNSTTRAIVVSGPWSMTVAPLQPHASYDFQLCLIALLTGVQRLSGVGVVDARDSKPYDALPPTDLLIEP